jgi:hypothetical protein
MHNQALINDFEIGMSQEWIQFAVENSNSFLLDEGKVMDEYVFNLN